MRFVKMVADKNQSHWAYNKHTTMESSERRKKQKTTVWSQEEDAALMAGILEFLESSGEEFTIDLDAVDWDEIATKMTGKTARECSVRVERIHRKGCLFATIEEVWPASERSSLSVASGWDTCKQSVFRGAPPKFLRFQLAGDNREADEFVNTHSGAVLDTTVVGKSVTTVNEALISVDIFGIPRDGAQKAHLLPRAREHALTWLYPGSAVLGLDTTADGWEVVAGKAVLGCTDTKTAIKYPGIRNFLCNLCRVASQGDFYDTNPRVFIFPILELVEARDWTGTTYEAIVLCDSGVVAQRIGMTNVDVGDASRASLDDVRKAAKLASALCEFLAHSVLQQGKDQVNIYQDDQQKLKHSHFREDKTIEVPKQIFPLLAALWPFTTVFQARCRPCRNSPTTPRSKITACTSLCKLSTNSTTNMPKFFLSKMFWAWPHPPCKTFPMKVACIRMRLTSAAVCGNVLAPPLETGY